jgi:hypothetical protein
MRIMRLAILATLFTTATLMAQPPTIVTKSTKEVQLETEIGTKKGKRTEKQTEVGAARQKKNEAQAKVSDLKRKQQELIDEAKDMATKLTAADQRKNAASAERTAKKDALDAIKLNKSLQPYEADAQRKLDEAEATLKAAEQDYQRLVTRNAAIGPEKSQVDNELRTATVSLTDAEKELSTLEGQLKSMQSEIDTLQVQLEEEQQKSRVDSNTQLLPSLKSTTDELKSRQVQKSELETMIQRLIENYMPKAFAAGRVYENERLKASIPAPVVNNAPSNEAMEAYRQLAEKYDRSAETNRLALVASTAALQEANRREAALVETNRLSTAQNAASQKALEEANTQRAAIVKALENLQVWIDQLNAFRQEIQAGNLLGKKLVMKTDYRQIWYHTKDVQVCINGLWQPRPSVEYQGITYTYEKTVGSKVYYRTPTYYYEVAK